MWHDFVTHLAHIQPPTAVLIARRHPEDTAPMTGSLSPDGSGLLVGPDQWFIPWAFITRWKFGPNQPPPSAPTDYLAHWRCDDQQAPAAEDVSGVNLETISGELTPVLGKLGGGFNMGMWDGANTGNPCFSFLQQPFTVRYWCQPDYANGYVADYSHIIIRATGWQTGLGTTPPGAPYFQVYGSGSMPTAPAKLSPGWHRILATYEPGLQTTLYVDDAAPAVAAAPTPNTEHLSFYNIEFRESVGAPNPQTFLDEVAIWNRVLTPAEINADWLAAPRVANTVQLMAATNPNLPLPSTTWRDTYAIPPANGQLCWVRRCPEDTASFKAVWTLDPEPYFLLEIGWQLPWYLATRWRPAAT